MDDAQAVVDDGVRRGWNSTTSGVAWVVGAGRGDSLGWLLQRFNAVVLYEPRTECFDALIAARERAQVADPSAVVLILPVGLAGDLGSYDDGTPHLSADMVISNPRSLLPAPDFIHVRHNHSEFLAGARAMLRRDAPSLLVNTVNDDYASWAGSYLEAQGYAKPTVVACPRTKLRYVRAKSPTGRGFRG